jgi:polyisoprenyl-phosphate glycosyltransferase
METQHRSDLTPLSSPGTRRMAPVVVLIPIFDDWLPCATVIERLDDALEAAGREVAVLLVDDGSTSAPTSLQLDRPLRAVRSIDVLRLRRNLGHQRAICIGLCHVDSEYDCDAVVVMDGDGEDDPHDVVRLLSRWAADPETIVFAERTRRSEGLGFRISYWFYRVLHRILTGKGVRVGNFSVVPRGRLRSLVVVSELWSHYAAAVFTSRLPFTTIPTRRARRLAGRSRMNFVALVTHGLSAISVFSEVVGVRVLLATLYVVAASFAGILTVVAIRFVTTWAVPGWATFAAGILLIILMLAIVFGFLFTFSILFARKSASMLPVRDYEYFIDSIWPVPLAHRAGTAGHRGRDVGA